MKKKLIALMLCAAMTLSTVLTGCGSSTSTSENKDGSGQTTEAAKTTESSDPAVYKELYSSESSTLNYLVTSTIAEQTVGANCVDTLVEYDSTGQLKEGLATEWSYDEATLTWTFKLRDAKWVDSTGAEVADVTAQDFVDALKYELTPEYESANVQNLFGIIANAKEYYNGLVYNGGTDEDGTAWEAIDFSEVGVKAVDDHTLTYAGIFIRLARQELISPKADRQMVEIFKKQHYNSMITKDFPPFYMDSDNTDDVMIHVASKSGSMNACRNDGGIIYTPYGAYVLVMLNKEFSDAMYYPGHPATTFGAKVSRMLLDQYLALEGRFCFSSQNP